MEGKVTLESIAYEKEHKQGNGPVTGVIKEVNRQTGKISTAINAFSETNWGDEGRKYFNSINENLRPTSLNKIIELARDHMKPARRGTSKTTATTATGRLEESLSLADQRMLVIDISDDENCPLSPLSAIFCYLPPYRILARLATSFINFMLFRLSPNVCWVRITRNIF